MNTEYEIKARYLQLKNFLSGISDISYSFQQLKEQARTNNVPLSVQIKELELLARQAEMLITAKEVTNGTA